ncbi:uncharacterized protein TNCV_2464451 [Trichonephila clavipes]|nr:uncharacterized protein TNCV_2464451 [Trichonephila clavipes]
MNEDRATKKVFNAQPIGRRRKGRPNLRRINCLKKDLLVLRTRNWRTLAGGRLAVGSLVVRAPDSEPKGLGSMPVPPNTLRVHTEYVLVKSVDPKVLWAESRVHGTGENFPPLQFHA